MSEKAIQIINTTDFSTLGQMADIATSSGYVKVNKAQAMFIMLKGTELGISPLQALDGINIIQGKPTISPALMLALINRSSELQDIKIDSQETECVVTMIRKGRSAHTERFSMEDARKMGLTGKDNYLKQAKTMLKWRAVSACARIVFPDVIQGVYTPEEMGAETIENDNGDVIITKDDAQPAPAPQIQIPATIEPTTTPVSESPAVIVEKPAEPPPATKTGYMIGDLYNAVRTLYTNGTHMQNSINAQKRDGKLTDDMTLEQAIAAVKTHCSQPKRDEQLPRNKPPSVAAAEKPTPAETDKAVYDDNPHSEAEARAEVLNRYNNEQVTLYKVEKREYVRGQGKMQGWRWDAWAKVPNPFGSESDLFINLYPEDVQVIEKAGHNFPKANAVVSIPVVLKVEDFKMRIDRENVPQKDKTPIADTSQQLWDDMKSANGKSEALQHMPI